MSIGKIVYIEDIDDLRELYASFIYSIVQKEVVDFASGKEGINYINKNLDDIILIVIDLTLPDISFDEMMDYMENKIKNTPVIIFSGSDKIDNPRIDKLLSHNCYNTFIQKPTQKEVFEKALQFLSKNNPKNSSKYLGIDVDVVQAMGTLPCDFFIKLSDDKFINILKKDTLLDESSLKKYKRKQVEKLYIETSNYELVLGKINNSTKTE
jgi:FixJ family two-component response regulator